MSNILIIEDEKVLSDAYRMILTKEGYKVTTAHDGQEALQIIDKADPDLILLDLKMPRMGGIDFLKAYKAENHPGVRIIIFSNLDMQNEIDLAHELGANKYILKAWASPKELARIVRETLAGK